MRLCIPRAPAARHVAAFEGSEAALQAELEATDLALEESKAREIAAEHQGLLDAQERVWNSTETDAIVAALAVADAGAAALAATGQLLAGVTGALFTPASGRAENTTQPATIDFAQSANASQHAAGGNASKADVAGEGAKPDAPSWRPRRAYL